MGSSRSFGERTRPSEQHSLKPDRDEAPITSSAPCRARDRDFVGRRFIECEGVSSGLPGRDGDNVAACVENEPHRQESAVPTADVHQQFRARALALEPV